MIGSIVLSGLVVLSGFAPAVADPGDLDPSFGDGGIVITDIQGKEDHGSDVLVQPDGRILVVGYSCQSCGAGEDVRYAAARYLPEGTLDPTFGRDGTIRKFEAGGVGYDGALQPNGRIVIGGSALAGGFVRQGLVRLRPNGRADVSFGDGGLVVNSSGAPATGVAIQPDGKIVTVGDDLLARYESSGALDSGFGSGGMVFDPIPGGGASELALLPDGKILVVGSDLFTYILVARYTPLGDLDSSFGQDGVARVSLGSFNLGSGIAVQSDGAILAVGGGGTSQDYDFALVRFTADGVLDSSFGDGGVVVTPVDGDHYANDVAVQSNGRILVTGSVGPFPRFDWAIVRYRPNGRLDGSFGDGGIAVTVVGEVSQPEAGPSGLDLQADGKIVVGGTARNLSGFDLGVVRYLAA